MTLHEPYKRLAALLAGVAGVNLVLLLTGSLLVTPVAFLSVWLAGFATAAVIVLRRDFYVEAVDQEGEQWELRWTRR